MKYESLLFLISSFVFATANVYNFRNSDGSYSIGLNSQSRGRTADSILALLTKSAGFTTNEADTQQSPSNVEVHTRSHVPESRNLLTPHLEILQLAETFLRLKGELVARAYQVANDNSDLIRSVYYTLVSKIGNLHAFTVTGITILRNILEFAGTLIGNWQPNLPPVMESLDWAGLRMGESDSVDLSSIAYADN